MKKNIMNTIMNIFTCICPMFIPLKTQRQLRCDW